MLRAEDVSGVRGEPTPERIYLTAIYKRIRYPAYARQNGIQGLVGVSYTIDTAGVLRADSCWVTDEDLANEETIPKDELIVVTGYLTQSVNGSFRYSVRPPNQSRNKKRLQRGQQLLCKEMVRTLEDLPTFVPARSDQKVVAVRDTQYVSYRLE